VFAARGLVPATAVLPPSQEEVCPYSNATRGNINVKLSVV
jgi:hypothetical protein